MLWPYVYSSGMNGLAMVKLKAVGFGVALLVVAAQGATAQNDTATTPDAQSSAAVVEAPGYCTDEHSSVFAVPDVACDTHQGDTISIYVRAPGLKARPTSVRFRRGDIGQSLTHQAPRAEFHGPAVFLLPMTLVSGDGLTAGSKYVVTTPKSCVEGFDWGYDLTILPDQREPKSARLKPTFGISVKC
jgi:hypothetical protein